MTRFPGLLRIAINEYISYSTIRIRPLARRGGGEDNSLTVNERLSVDLA